MCRVEAMGALMTGSSRRATPCFQSRTADPPLLACLLTRLAMRDRNRDTRPALRQQAVGGGGGRVCGHPPPRCLKLATVEDLRPGSGRALPGRKASASFVYAELLSPGEQPWPLLTRRGQHGEPCAPSPTPYRRGYGPLLAVELSAPRSLSQFRQGRQLPLKPRRVKSSCRLWLVENDPRRRGVVRAR